MVVCTEQSSLLYRCHTVNCRTESSFIAEIPRADLNDVPQGSQILQFKLPCFYFTLLASLHSNVYVGRLKVA